MKKITMTALAAAMASSVAVAEVSVPNTFVQGENAVAAEVNANFEALVEAINNNAEAIAELKSDSSTLSVAGKTYQVFQYGVEIKLDNVGKNTAIMTEKFVVTFNEDMSVDVDGDELSGQFRLAGVNPPDDPGYEYVDVERDSYSNADEIDSDLGWSRNGNVVTINSSDEEVGTKFLIAPGARTLIDLGVFTDGSNVTEGEYFEAELLLGVQVTPE